MSTKEKQLLFQLRTRTTPTRANYKSQFKFDLTCPLCKDQTSEQTDAHLLDCSGVAKILPVKNELEKIRHDMIFNASEEQTKIVKIYKEIFRSI